MTPADGSATTLEFALLGLLALEPRSGYDLLKVFGETAMGNYSSSPGAIYPALRRLERRGLIAGEVDGAKTLRPKKVFEPTAAGDKVLRAWLRAEISRDDVRRGFDELLLRFAFYSLLGNRATREFLGALAERLDGYVKELVEQRKIFPADAPAQGRMAFELGLEQYRAAARWARKALRQIEEEPR